MKPDLLALGRRAVACPAFRWNLGMWAVDTVSRLGFMVVDVADGLLYGAEGRRLTRWDGVDPARFVPLMSHAGTRGEVMALVREAWSDPLLTTEAPWRGDHRWVVVAGPDDGMGERRGVGATEAEALVNSLETAPKAKKE